MDQDELAPLLCCRDTRAGGVVFIVVHWLRDLHPILVGIVGRVWRILKPGRMGQQVAGVIGSGKVLSN
jgi:hypothetical protein